MDETHVAFAYLILSHDELDHIVNEPFLCELGWLRDENTIKCCLVAFAAQPRRSISERHRDSTTNDIPFLFVGDGACIHWNVALFTAPFVRRKVRLRLSI